MNQNSSRWYAYRLGAILNNKVMDGLYGKIQTKAEPNRIKAILLSYQVEILFVSG
jgi:hypothetical protein